MSIAISKLSSNKLRITKNNRWFYIFGLTFITVPIIFFISFMILHPERMGKSIEVKFFSCFIMIILMMLLLRVIYFTILDRNVTIIKRHSTFQLNKNEYLYTAISSLLIKEYLGFRTMPNGFHLFLKFKSGKKIAAAIRVNKSEMEYVRNELILFLSIEKVVEKKWWMI